MNHEDYSYESIDVLDYLKQLYPDCVDPKIESLRFCQDRDETWIETVYNNEPTPLGFYESRKITSLDFIIQDFEGTPAYLATRNINENAYDFLHDTGVLRQAVCILVADPEEKIENDDVEEADDDTHLEDNDEMMQIMNFLQDLFSAYLPICDVKERKRITGFQNYIFEALNQFMAGEEPQEFSFSLLLEVGDEKRWIDVATDGACLTLDEEGHIYDPDFGGDSYTDWMFTIWNDGDEDGDFGLDIDTALEMINMGAKIDISLPEEFIPEDETEENN